MPATAQVACTPYAPSEGLFLNTQSFAKVPTTGVTVGPYVISENLTNSTVTVSKAETVVASIQMTNGKAAWYLSFPSTGPAATANRFLILDIHSTDNVAAYIDYSPIALDLGAWKPGQILSGYPLNFDSIARTSAPQYHVFPSTDGFAFYSWYGKTLGGQSWITSPTVYRSDSSTAKSLCAASSYTSVQQPSARIRNSSVELLNGGTLIQPTCPLPKGTLTVLPLSQDFGSTSPSAPKTRSYVFGATGNDCVTVGSIASSLHFQPIGFSPFSVSPGGSSHQQPVSFVPGGAVGSFAEDLLVGRTPALGPSSFRATGTSCSGFGTWTDCGTCGHQCPGIANGNATCSAGICGVSCSLGFVYCNGACISVASDIRNCGACGKTCDGAGAGTAICSAGTCSCTIPPSPTNPAMCGACGNVCSAPAGGQAQCSGGSCYFTCVDPAYAACGGQCSAILPPASGGPCATDCDCGTGPALFCAAGVGSCATSSDLSSAFALNQVVPFTGTSSGGASGAYVPVTGSTTTFSVSQTRNVAFHFDCKFSYSSGPSSMLLDLRLMLDGVEVAKVRGNQYVAILDALVPSVGPGSHNVRVEARGVLDSGPPISIKLTGAPANLAATSLNCSAGGGQCQSTSPTGFTFTLGQTIPFSGTSTTTEGPFVEVKGSRTLISTPTTRSLDLKLTHYFWYPTSYSQMQLDLRFMIDGVEAARTRVNPYSTLANVAVANVGPGVHNLWVEARSVLLGGPPVTTYLYGYGSRGCGGANCAPSATTLSYGVIR